MFKKIILGLMASVISVSSYALQSPHALASDPRIKVVSYQSDNVVSIHGTTFINTQVLFGDNEKIIDVQGGDAAAWTVNIDKSLPNVLNIKPTDVGSTTDLSVVTIDDSQKKRFYHFDLASQPQNTVHPEQTIYAVQFVYPEEARAKLLADLNYLELQKQTILNASHNPNDYNWDYSFSGSHSIMPLHIFDDGKFTYMQLRPNQDIPAVFSVNNKQGEEAVVNFRRQGNYLIVQQVSPQFTLRDGKHLSASVFNNPLAATMNRNG